MKKRSILEDEAPNISDIEKPEGDLDKVRVDPAQFLLRDIMIEIFKNLSVKELSSISLVCKTWLRISSDDRVWSSVVSTESRELKRHEIEDIVKEGKNVKSKYILNNMQRKKWFLQRDLSNASIIHPSFILFPTFPFIPVQEDIDRYKKRLEAHEIEIAEMESSLNISIR